MRDTRVARVGAASSAEEAFAPLIHAIVTMHVCESAEVMSVQLDGKTVRLLIDADASLRVLPERVYKRLAWFAEKEAAQATYQAAYTKWATEARVRRLLFALDSEDPPATLRALFASIWQQTTVPANIMPAVERDEQTGTLDAARETRLITVGTAADAEARPVRITAAGKQALKRGGPKPERTVIRDIDRDAFAAAGIPQD